MSLLVQALFSLLPIVAEHHNRVYSQNRQTSGAQKMGKPGMLRVFISSSHIIENIERNHLRTGVLRMNQSQTIIQNMPVDLQHIYSITETLIIFTSSSGRSLRSVFTCWILSTMSMPSTTSPKTVYSPSRCGVPPTVV